MTWRRWASSLVSLGAGDVASSGVVVGVVGCR